MKTYRQTVNELFDQHLKPIAGVEEALSKIDLPMCVASSGPQEKIEKVLALTGLLEFFKGNIFSSYVVGSWKPDPGLFLFAAEAMSALPEKCIVIEDSDVGVAAAKSAGMRVVWFNDDISLPDIPGAERLMNMAELPQLVHKVQRSNGSAISSASSYSICQKPF